MNFADRVRDTITSSGTGPFTLSGTSPTGGFQPISAIGPVGSTFPYSASSGNLWETGSALITAANTVARIPLASSNGGSLVSFPAGADFFCAPSAAQAKKYESGTSTRMVFTSSLCVSDSVLDMTPTTGVDQTTKLQALLDLAASGPLLLMWDGAYSVIGQNGALSALRIRSNTSIVALPGCGAVNLPNNPACMFSNFNATINPANAVDKNISFSGGIWHGNRDAQTAKNTFFFFAGVDGLSMLGGHELRKAKAFAWQASNSKHITINRGRVDFGAGNTDVNTDSYHFNGPCRYINISEVELFNGADDAIALNADDAWGTANFTGPYDNVYGPIEDVTINGVYLQGSVCGVRLLSGGSPMRRISINNIKGKTGGYWIVADNFNGTQEVLAGPGNIEDLSISNVNMENVHVNGWPDIQAHFNCKINRLSLKDITKSKYGATLYPAIRIGERGNIGQLTIDNFNGVPDSTGKYVADQIQFANGSQVGLLRVTNSEFYSDSTNAGSPISVESGAVIGRALLTNLTGMNFSSFLRNNGTISNLHTTNNFMDSPAASTWTLEQGYSEQSDSGLTFTGYDTAGHSGVKKAVDTFNGNIQLKVRVKLTTTGSSSNAAASSAILFRGTNAYPWSNSTVTYFFSIASPAPATSDQGGFCIGFKNGASTTILTSVIGSAVFGETYEATITAKGTSITVAVQRISDSFWLQTNGTFSASQAVAFTVTNTSIAAGTGLQYGVYSYAYNSVGPATASVTYTNFAAIAAP